MAKKRGGIATQVARIRAKLVDRDEKAKGGREDRQRELIARRGISPRTEHADYFDALHQLYQELNGDAPRSDPWLWPVASNTCPERVALKAAVYALEHRIDCPGWVIQAESGDPSIDVRVTEEVNDLRASGSSLAAALEAVGDRYKGLRERKKRRKHQDSVYSGAKWAEKHYLGSDIDRPPTKRGR
jgi:hypothetical protein